MLAKILIAPETETRVGESEKILEEHRLNKNHPDVLWFEDGEKFGVEQAKKIREFLSLKPYSAKNRAVVILSAQKLTDEAQNSLLKTLEEPPENAILILGADSENNFLSTILSRCQIVILATKGSPKSSQGLDSGVSASWQIPRMTDGLASDIEKLIGSTIEQRFEYIEKLKDREDFLQALIDFFQKCLESQTKVGVMEFGKELLQAEEWVKSNGNIRAVLEYLMLKMPEESDK